MPPLVTLQSRNLSVDPLHHLGATRLRLYVPGRRGSLLRCHQGSRIFLDWYPLSFLFAFLPAKARVGSQLEHFDVELVTTLKSQQFLSCFRYELLPDPVLHLHQHWQKVRFQSRVNSKNTWCTSEPSKCILMAFSVINLWYQFSLHRNLSLMRRASPVTINCDAGHHSQFFWCLLLTRLTVKYTVL